MYRVFVAIEIVSGAEFVPEYYLIKFGDKFYLNTGIKNTNPLASLDDNVEVDLSSTVRVLGIPTSLVKISAHKHNYTHHPLIIDNDNNLIFANDTEDLTGSYQYYIIPPHLRGTFNLKVSLKWSCDHVIEVKAAIAQYTKIRKNFGKPFEKGWDGNRGYYNCIWEYSQDLKKFLEDMEDKEWNGSVDLAWRVVQNKMFRLPSDIQIPWSQNKSLSFVKYSQGKGQQMRIYEVRGDFQEVLRDIFTIEI